MNVLQSLQKDHGNFDRVLGLLGEQLTLLQQAELPDFQLMLDIVDYLQNYADLYHHPKEDAIFGYHLERCPEGRTEIELMIRQHVELRQNTSQMRFAIDGILHGDIMLRAEFTERLANFIEQQSDHLKAEETQLFPLFSSLFSAADWRFIEKLIPTRNDPLFGETVEKQYTAILDRIAEVC
ncbi:MAG: hemerythrin domain-containing protein [Gammaproteobacteria bacterium]|nr:hemerythrin domain-containing protein [Gammaproteobacteria bacterium]MCP5458113.1 hemerythrin domain-containing protein [Gammaproteobacteria bacterium]